MGKKINSDGDRRFSLMGNKNSNPLLSFELRGSTGRIGNIYSLSDTEVDKTPPCISPPQAGTTHVADDPGQMGAHPARHTNEPPPAKDRPRPSHCKNSPSSHAGTSVQPPRSQVRGSPRGDRCEGSAPQAESGKPRVVSPLGGEQAAITTVWRPEPRQYAPPS